MATALQATITESHGLPMHCALPRRARLRYLIGVGSIVFSADMTAQDAFTPPDSRAVMRAVRTASAIEVDGHLDEQAWQSAPAVSGFRQIDPAHGEPARFGTEVRILFDDANLYLGAFLRDSMGAAGARVQDLRRDFGYYTNDIFGVNLDGFGDGRFAMVFQTNSKAVQRDLLVIENQIFDIEWNGVWSVRTVESDSGWTVEMAIPWSTLRYSPEQRSWRINFHRMVRRAQEESGWSLVGALLIRQEGHDSVGSSVFGVGRYIQNVGESGRIGALIATRADEGTGTASVAQTVASTDVFFRPTRTFTVSGMASQTFTDAAGGNGTAAYVWARNQAPWGYVGWIQEVVTEGYRPATGFVRRRNYIWTSPFTSLDWRPSWRPSSVRAFKPAMGVDLYHSPSDGAFQEATWSIRPVDVTFENGAVFGLSAVPTWQQLERPFAPLAGISIDAGRYSYTRWQAFAGADPSAPFGGRVDASTGRFYDGRLHTLGVTSQATLSPHVAFFANYSLNALRHVGAAGADKITQLVAPEVRLALNPRVQLTGFYQYNSAAELSSWNARFSWEFRPLSYLYLVYNDRAAIDPGSGLAQPGFPGERQLILKLTWLGQL